MRATKYTVREWKLYDFAYTNYLKNLFDGDSSLDFFFFWFVSFLFDPRQKEKNEYRNTKRVLSSGDAI